MLFGVVDSLVSWKRVVQGHVLFLQGIDDGLINTSGSDTDCPYECVLGLQFSPNPLDSMKTAVEV